MSTVVVPARVQRVALTSEPIANCSSSASVDRLFVSADVSTDAEEDQGQFKVWHKIELRKFR